MAKIILMVQVNNPHFEYQLRASQDARLVEILQFQPKSVMSCYADKPNFLEFWVKMTKMTLKESQSQWPYFQYQLRLS